MLLNETASKKHFLQSIAEQIILIRKKLVHLAIRNWMPFVNIEGRANPTLLRMSAGNRVIMYPLKSC